jgi:hypothetical protein
VRYEEAHHDFDLRATADWPPSSTFSPANLGNARCNNARSPRGGDETDRDPFAYLWAAFAGMAKLYVGRDEEAAAWLRWSIEFNRNYSTALWFLAISLARRGKLDEARAAVGAGLTLDPTFNIRRFRDSAVSDNPA